MDIRSHQKSANKRVQGATFEQGFSSIFGIDIFHAQKNLPQILFTSMTLSKLETQICVPDPTPWIILIIIGRSQISNGKRSILHT